MPRQHRDDIILGRQSVINLYVTAKSLHINLGRGEKVRGEGVGGGPEGRGRAAKYNDQVLISGLSSI